MSDDFEKYADEITDSLKPFPPLVPFDELSCPAFPLRCLPPAVREMVEHLSVSTQTPPEMAGLLALGVLSTLFQARFSVEITPDWKEPLCLYCVAVASPGERKSAVISALTKPVFDYEIERRTLDAAEIERNRAEYDILEARLHAAEKAAVSDPAKKQLALDLAAEYAEFECLHERRWLVDDTTPEKLVELMEKQNGCLTVCSAEGGVFDAMQGRYERGLNLDIYLKAHAGDPVVVDRMSRRSNSIPAPRLSMLLTVQPQVLSGMMNNTAFRGRGLCGRFLYSICQSKVGLRDVSPPPIPETVREDYRAFIRRALSAQEKGIIRLSPDADEIRKAFQETIEKRLGGEWEAMRDWGGKLVGAMLRIAALFHCASGGTAETEISPKTLLDAIDIAEVLGQHAAVAFQLMGADADTADAQYIWKRLSGIEKATRSELLRQCRGHFKKASDMAPALAVLADRGYIREITAPVGYNNRQQILYEFNPAVMRN